MRREHLPVRLVNGKDISVKRTAVRSFLDEVGELPLPTQARLLRVLESGEFIKVGSSKVQKTDVRIVAATEVSTLRKLLPKDVFGKIYIIV